MKVLSPHRYDLRGGLVLEKGENVLDRVSPIAQGYLDKLIASGIVTVLDDETATQASMPVDPPAPPPPSTVETNVIDDHAEPSAILKPEPGVDIDPDPKKRKRKPE